MSSSLSSSSNEALSWTAFAAMCGAVSVGALAALQTDTVSRKMLSSDRLEAKRRQEYNYRWVQGVERAHLQLDYYLAGGMNAYNNDPEIVLKKAEFISGDTDMDALAQRIVEDKQSKFTCLKIDRDPMDPKGEFHLYLLEEKERDKELGLYELPLMPFGMKIATTFENQITTTTLCFVADASAGKGSSLLEALVKESKTGVAVLSEPLWMVQIARVAQAQMFPSEKIKKLLFGLCRLDAWKLRDEAKESHTVMITLPGQATTSTLLPLLQSTFPEDRHVFAYDTCGASVYRGSLQTKAYRRGKVRTELDDVLTGLAQNPIRHTTPLPSNSPITKSLFGLRDSLSQLPLDTAQGVETWMGSVDSFFKLKQDENTNGYLPYTWKVSFLTEPDNPTFEPESTSYWSLCSLLQFVTGCKSRSLPEGVIDAASRFLEDYNTSNPEPKELPYSKQEEKAIEECVFHHKLILIPNKTLQDTVKPTQHWTLKQAAKKGGCACCGPDPFDEEEEEEEERRKAEAALMATPGGFAMATGNTARPKNGTSAAPARTGYVDGKLGFAFDPTKFS